MINRFESRSGRLVKAIVVVALATTALEGCASADESMPGQELQAVVDSNGHGGTVARLVLNGQPVELYDGTKVEAWCVSGAPFNLEALIIDTPAHGGTVGSVIYDLPRQDLTALNDPYGANAVGQDPFGPLPSCGQ